MAKCGSVPVMIHAPERKEEVQKLERQLADVYADDIITTLNKLACPAEQKRELLQSVIDSVSAKKLEK